MTRFPDFDRGKTWPEFNAEEWNALRLSVMQFANLDVRPPLRFIRQGDRAMLAIDLQLMQTAQLHITVLVTKTPSDVDRFLHIRQVRHMDVPPRSGRYEWASDDMRGFPDFGADLVDYEEFVWLPNLADEVRDGPPDITSPFLRARSLQGLWIVERQQSKPDRLVVAKGFDDPASRFITVQEIAPTDTDPWDGQFDTVGDPILVAVWPTMSAGDFQPFLWEVDALDDLMTVLPLVWRKGIWWLMQLPKWRVARRTGPLKTLDCTGVEDLP